MNKELKPFDRIIIKSGETWRCSLFSHYNSEGGAININGIHFPKGKYLPFEGNEHLVGTDIEPQPKRWRAEIKKLYFYVTADLLVTSTIEFGDCSDDIKYENGNYFKTSEEAEEMAEKIKKILNDE